MNIIDQGSWYLSRLSEMGNFSITNNGEYFHIKAGAGTYASHVLNLETLMHAYAYCLAYEYKDQWK